MKETIETVIIGGGQAGLATSYFLKQRGREHIVLEKSDRPGSAWRDNRWDTFTLVTPNWSFRLPGAGYSGPDPDGYMERDDIVAYFERYVERFELPVQYQTIVQSVEPDSSGQGYRVQTDQGEWQARNVVVATGMFQTPKIPPSAARIDPGILQLHSGQYRNPGSLPAGAVLVVGSGQSGCQIAEELYQAGRTVYLSTGSAGRAPRRYRGKDIYEWLLLCGFLDRTADMLPVPQARFKAIPHLSGKNGGHALNLHTFHREGVRLLGRFQEADRETVYFAPDLKENLAKADQFEAEMVRMVDGFIAKSGAEAPEEALVAQQDGFEAEQVLELKLASAGISTIIWAMGYVFDFKLVGMPVFEPNGFPIQQRGRTAYPGLYFVGLPWMHQQKSGLLVGVGEAAETIAQAIAGP